MIKAEVWYNRDPFKRLGLGPFGTALDPDDYDFIVGLPVDAEATRASFPAQAERIWRRMNVVDGNELPMTLHCRSMDMGDVVAFHDEDGPTRTFVARLMGFEEVEFELDPLPSGTKET